MARRGFQGAVLRTFGARDHDATVIDVERIAPLFQRVRFHAETVWDDMSPWPTAWLRMWFPDPDGSEVEHQRAYTLSESDEAARTFAVDFVLHEPAGPASSWAKTVQPGQSLPVMSLGSRPFTVPDDPPAGYLLIGDSASLPAINSVLTVIPHTIPVEVYLEEHHPDDSAIPLTPHPLMRIHRPVRDDETSLAAAIEDRDWSNWYAWATPESASLKHVRTRLKEFGFPKTEIHQDEIVERVPDGLDAAVGEAGTALSGGERQRVSIARALLKAAPILLIDEATSALDTENEAAVVAALGVEQPARTSVVVAHRLETIRGADRVLFLRDGRITEDGSVAELLDAGGEFAEFWRQRSDAARWRLDGAGSEHPSRFSATDRV